MTDHPGKCSIESCENPIWVKKVSLCSSHYRRLLRHGTPYGGSTANGALLDFLENALSNKTDECIIWPFGHNGTGYGKITIDGIRQFAHRVVCERKNGPPPTPLHQAAHSCGNGNKGCITPSHIRWATPSENQRDRVAHGTHNRGERYGRVKLKESEVLEIRSLRGKMLQREIAESFGVSTTTVCQIQKKNVWSWLD